MFATDARGAAPWVSAVLRTSEGAAPPPLLQVPGLELSVAKIYTGFSTSQTQNRKSDHAQLHHFCVSSLLREESSRCRKAAEVNAKIMSRRCCRRCVPPRRRCCRSTAWWQRRSSRRRPSCRRRARQGRCAVYLGELECPTVSFSMPSLDCVVAAAAWTPVIYPMQPEIRAHCASRGCGGGTGARCATGGTRCGGPLPRTRWRRWRGWRCGSLLQTTRRRLRGCCRCFLKLCCSCRNPRN